VRALPIGCSHQLTDIIFPDEAHSIGKKLYQFDDVPFEIKQVPQTSVLLLTIFGEGRNRNVMAGGVLSCTTARVSFEKLGEDVPLSHKKKLEGEK